MTQDEMIGQRIGDFTILEKIGQGGMGLVYRARQEAVQRDVALKILQLNEETSSQVFQQRFQNEASIIASLDHIHILPVHDYGIQDNIAYIAMRYLRGGSLRDRLKKGTLSLEQTDRILDQVAQGLGRAHDMGVIHRDIKPGNILFDDNDNAYLADFGLAKIMGSGQDITQTQNIMGTLEYMSPQQLKGEVLDSRTDIYSLGIIIYQMLCGDTPFNSDSDNAISVIYKHLEESPIPPHKVNPEISEAVSRVVMKALEKEPDNRYQDVRDFAKAFDNAIKEQPTSEQLTVPISSTNVAEASALSVQKRKGEDKPKRRIWLAAGVLTLFIAIVGGILLVTVVIPNSMPQSTFTVLEGEIASAEDIAPDPEDIVLAQQALGERGFIALLPCTQASEYHATLIRETTDILRDFELAFQIYDSDSDIYIQRPLLERSISEGASGFILCGLDYRLLDDTLQVINQRHYPLVHFEQPEDTYGGVALSSASNNYDLGFLAGELAGEIVRDEMNGEAKVIILDFPDMEALVQRATGLEEGLLQNAPEATLVENVVGGTREYGYESVKALLEQGTEFDVILSINDAGSYGAVEALTEAQVPNDAVMIFSIDAEELAQQYIVDHVYFRATLDLSKGRELTAQSAAYMITRMLAGDEVPEFVNIPAGEMLTFDSITAEQTTPNVSGWNAATHSILSGNRKLYQ